MIKKTACAFFFSCIFLANCFSQDSIPKTNQRYFGIQANQLLRQILNFSSSNSAINNPYLLTYSVNNPMTGWGINLGWGYNYNQITDGDAFTQRKTTISDLAFRIGFEKKRRFGKHWILSSGIDAVIDAQSNKTKTTTPGAAGSVATKNTTNGIGLGPRLALYFNVSEKILVGTELTYYFKALNTRTKVSGNFQQPDITDSLNKLQLNLPAAIFLVLKL
jgi:hypothetical protein